MYLILQLRTFNITIKELVYLWFYPGLPGAVEDKQPIKCREDRSRDHIGLTRLTEIRLAVLDHLFSKIESVEELGGERCIPYFQVSWYKMIPFIIPCIMIAAQLIYTYSLLQVVYINKSFTYITSLV